ncbi:MAG: DUF4065 domain-containing protein [Puniceicoccales bacterium]|jgi:uncharacterized phage-associated protein|nr:DUF4065 domain-containing protein [Puniceicoccales bacterium]
MPQYTALTVANTFIGLAKSEGWALTNMQVQKLVFLAHGFHMAHPWFKREALVSEPVEAWRWGPVFPSLYTKLKEFGGQPIREPIPAKRGEQPSAVPDTDPAYALIKAVWKAYGKFNGIQLSRMTHLPGSPWQQVWDFIPRGIIPNELISNYYEGLTSKNVSKAAAITTAVAA